MTDHPIDAMTTEPDRLAAEQDRLTAELRAWADKEATTCTCGSGGHPRPCDVHPDRYAAHCAELSAEAAYDELQELLSALAVPSHADPVEWARALVHLVETLEYEDAKALFDDPDDVHVRTAFDNLRLLRLRTPPHPLPDGPGWWHLAGGGLAKVSEGPGCAGWCVDDIIDNTLAEEALKQVREPWGASRPLHVSELSWLTGPDGKAVRCVPPDERMRDLAREVVTLPGFRWDLPWCSLPDEHGRVFRRNCSPDDPGFGWSQVAGPRLRCRWSSSSVVIDLRDAGSRGALHELVEEACGGPVSVECWHPQREPCAYVRRAEACTGPNRVEALVALWREVTRG